MQKLANTSTSRWPGRARLAIALATPILLAACETPVSDSWGGEAVESRTAEGHRISYGKPMTLGNGKVRTYLVSDRGGEPVSLGVEMSEGVLTGLPEQAGMYHLPLPKNATSVTQYTFVMFDWNPHGHEPEHFYGNPHFDFHFYMQDEHEVMTIPGGPDPVPVDPKVLPAGFIAPGQEAVPAMGVHWVDSLAPELNGQGFTETFIWGTWQGKVTFIEPMITKAFLETRPNLTIPVKQPEVYQVPGYYPQTYGIRYDARGKVLRISIDELVKR